MSVVCMAVCLLYVCLVCMFAVWLSATECGMKIVLCLSAAGVVSAVHCVCWSFAAVVWLSAVHCVGRASSNQWL